MAGLENVDIITFFVEKPSVVISSGNINKIEDIFFSRLKIFFFFDNKGRNFLNIYSYNLFTSFRFLI